MCEACMYQTGGCQKTPSEKNNMCKSCEQECQNSLSVDCISCQEKCKKSRYCDIGGCEQKCKNSQYCK